MSVAILIAALALTAQAARAAGTDRRTNAIVALIHRQFDRAGEGARAVCVARHESTFRPWVSNGEQDGIFQLARGTWDPAVNPAARPIVGDVDWSRIFQPAYNAMVAFRIWKHSGWLPAWNADAEACGL